MGPRSLQWYLKDAWVFPRVSLQFSLLHSRFHFLTMAPVGGRATSQEGWVSQEKGLLAAPATCPKVQQMQHFASLEAQGVLGALGLVSKHQFLPQDLKKIYIIRLVCILKFLFVQKGKT